MAGNSNRPFSKLAERVLLPVVAPDDAGRIQSQSPRRAAVLTGEANRIPVKDDFDSSSVRDVQLHAGRVWNAVCCAGAEFAVDESVITASLYGNPDRTVQAQYNPRV